MICKNAIMFRLTVVTTNLFLISLIYFYLRNSNEYILYSNRWKLGSEWINNFTTSKTKFTFIIDKGYWNFTLNSFLQIELEADITPNMSSFVQNNVKYLEKVYNPKISIVEQAKHYGSMSAAGIKIRISTTESVTLIFSRVWYAKTICYDVCNPDRSYIYVEAFTSDYHRTFYNLTLKNGQIIRFPSILNITQSEIDGCCLGPEDPRVVLDENNQIFVTFNMIDVDKYRKIWIYDMTTDHQASLSIQNKQLSKIEKNWTPFIINDNFYFIYSYKHLNILHCPFKNGTCEFISNIQNSNEIGGVRGGTQLVRFRNTDYFVGLAHTTISCYKCDSFYRPHLVVLSTTAKKFHLAYVSEPLMLDNLPIFASYYLQRNKNSPDFCNNIIRIMTPGSIIDWKWPDDKLTFTVSINDKRCFVMSVIGIGNVVQNIISSIETYYSQVFFNNTLNTKMISHNEAVAVKYCESVSRKQTG